MDVRLEGSHQATRNPDSDERPRNHEGQGVFSHSEQGGTGRCQHDQRCLNLSGSVFVQHDAERHLGRRKRNEIGTGHETEIGR